MNEQSRPDRGGNVLVQALRSPWSRLALLLALLGGSSWLAVTRGTGIVAAARDWTASTGEVGWVLFVLVYTMATIVLFPDALLSAAAGVLFGPVVGIVLVWCGATLGAAASFLLGRVLSRDAVQRLTGDRIDRLNGFLARRGTVAVLLVRLIPLFPFGVVNYGSAVTTIGFRQYLIGTALGMLPGIAVYVTLGAAVTDPTSPAFLISAGALLLLAIGGALVARRTATRGGSPITTRQS